MNQLEAKQKKTLLALIEADDYTTLENLAVKSGVSRRSVQNHIESIAQWLKVNGFDRATLIKKPGLGIRLLLPDGKLGVYGALERGNPLQDDNERQKDILKTLTFSDGEYTIGYFADHYYVSRATILKDLEWVERWLSRFRITLYRVQCRGVGIAGDELSKRNAMAAFVELFGPKSEAQDGGICGGRISKEQYESLCGLYPKLDVAAIARIITQAEGAFEFFLTGDFFTSLLTHLTICIARELSGNDNEDYGWPDEIRAEEPELSTAQYIASKLQERFGLALPPSERAYICLHLMSYNMSYMLDGSARSERQKGLEPLAISIIAHFENAAGIPFSKDKTLYTGLLLHLNATVYRMRSNIYVRPAQLNPADVDADLLDAAKSLSGMYEQACGFELSEEELLALAVHLTLARKRAQRKKQALFVGGAGVAAGYAVCQTALSDIEGVEIVDVVSSKVQLSTILELKYDFIISTVPIENAAKPVINISQLAQSEYKRHITEFINEMLN